MSLDHFTQLLNKFNDVRMMAVGDIYLDEYVYGSVTEISLEAPIPVLEVQERSYNPGAAGNAACNAASLGGKVYMVGMVGSDANADIVRHEFEVRGVDTSHLVAHPNRPTNTYGKLRAGGHNIPTQEVLRTDTPKPTPIDGETEAKIIAEIEALAPQVNAVMLGDQACSVLTDKVLKCVVTCAEKHKLVTVADSRKRAGVFHGIDVVVPNDAEAALAAGIELTDDASLREAGKALLKSAKNALVTRGPAGITVFAQDGSIDDVPIAPIRAIDVTGAGDTVAAAVTLTLASGGSLTDAAFLGNTAAGIAVVQEGVVTVSNDEVAAALAGAGQGPVKLKTVEQLKPILNKLKGEGKKVVWTNGCFDILHAGHISYLMRARDEGDVLVVGMNSDASVCENKGPDRPVVPEDERAIVLSAMECVDYIILFDGMTPMPLLEALEPCVYAKGGDYTVDTIVQEERHLVEGYGGSIAIIPGIEGRSTSNIIARISREQ
jgi:D-beta-D-heptose 7-phosphate kinase / D-beta-D-heptose 1-phosphate adenosyltransferase